MYLESFCVLAELKRWSLSVIIHLFYVGFHKHLISLIYTNCGEISEHQSINEFILWSFCIQYRGVMIQSCWDGCSYWRVWLCVFRFGHQPLFQQARRCIVSLYLSLFWVYKLKKCNSYNNTRANTGRLTAAFCAVSDLGSFHYSVLKAYGSKYIFTAICASWLFLIAVLCVRAGVCICDFTNPAYCSG